MILCNKRTVFLIASVIAILLVSFGCTQLDADKNDEKPKAVNFVSVLQTGGTDGFVDSTGLILTFDVDPTTLTADNITLTGAIKGILTGSGTTRTLAISNITVGNGQTVSIAITNPSGYTISGSPKTAVVYKDTRTPVTFESAVQTGGTDGFVDSTGLILTFDVDPTTLTADNITLTGAIKGILTGSGTTRTLAISNITVGNGQTVSIAITSPSGYNISGSSKTAVVYKNPLPGVSYRELVSITGGAYPQTDGTNSFSHTISSFSLGKYEVTYELWYTVRQWAISMGYSFANAGREYRDGIDGEPPTEAKYQPVIMINWRDAIVWCNAYSEMLGYTPCYTYSGSTIKDARDSNANACDNAVCNWSANGYRLPLEGEWQFAASNKGATLWNYASGANADYNNATECQRVAWYNANSGYLTKQVGTRDANALGIYDMSGNVWEWCWDLYGTYPTTVQTDYRGVDSNNIRIFRGGGWNYDAYYLIVGYRIYNSMDWECNYIGFRITRTN